MGSEFQDVVIGVVDVGSPKNIGWAILSSDGDEVGHDLDVFIKRFGELAEKAPAALGFEAPMFVPFGRPLERLTAQRNGEGRRPWSAGAGATVTTIGLVVVCHVLAGLRERLPDRNASLDWRDWLASSHELLLFEAFVSGANHAAPGEHEVDALNAARAFQASLGGLDAANAVCEDQVFSLVGACMARTGWETGNPDLLSQPCLVIRP